MRTLWLSFISVCLMLIVVPAMSANSSARKNAAKSTQGSDLPLMKDSLIRILSYDPATKTYEVESANFPGEGESHITPEALSASAPDAVNLPRILRNPESIVGQEFQINSSLPTLFPNEREARRSGGAPAPVKKSQSNRSGAR